MHWNVGIYFISSHPVVPRLIDQQKNTEKKKEYEGKVIIARM